MRGWWHEAARILHASDPYWSCARIAEVFGVTPSAVWKALNPEAARKMARASNEQPDRKRRMAQWHREHYNETHKDDCACGERKVKGSVLCSTCWCVVGDVRRSLTEGMWAAGWTVYEIEAALGVDSGGGYISSKRARGWDLPHRRTPEQVQRIREGRWAERPLDVLPA